MPSRNTKTLIDLARELREDSIQGVNELQPLIGRESNPDLRAYKRLANQDFRLMTSIFGPDSVINYIKTMEFFRLRRDV